MLTDACDPPAALATAVMSPLLRLLLSPLHCCCIFNCAQMLVFYTWSVRNMADAISLLASTEKIGWMATKTPQEGEALYSAETGPAGSNKDPKDAGKMIVAVDGAINGAAPSGWPRRGTVEFDNVWMKYLPSAPYALKGKIPYAPRMNRILP
jgi:hypothetical protein